MISVSQKRQLLPLLALAVGAGCLATDPDPTLNGTPADTVEFQSVDAGALHACGIGVGGEGFCWGENGLGQLGVGDVENRTEPTAVLQGELVFTEMSAGASHTCALTDGRELYCWGSNQFGQLGSAAAGGQSTPVRLSNALEFATVSVGGAHACGLAASAAYCWGLAGGGQLGTGVTGEVARPNPEAVLGGHSFQELSAGNQHTCAVTPAGEAYCWGDGSSGELGNGGNVGSAEPVAVSGGILFRHISAGDEHTCGTALDGVAYCWGAGDDGRLGYGGVSDSNEPVLVNGGITFASISAGGAHTCGVAGNGIAYCWGRNSGGQLGDGSTTSRLEPTPVSGALEFETVSAGTGPVVTATCGFGSDGLVYCWGDGLSGQLGNGATTSVSVPTVVSNQR
jgi:alpha-tubulin suppressor-like RCC1 family protein